MITDSEIVPLTFNIELNSFSTAYVKDNVKYCIGANISFLPNFRVVSNGIYEVNLENGSCRKLKDSFSETLRVSTPMHHYHSAFDDKPQIIQYDHDLNIRMTINESQLREYGALAPDDEHGRKRNKKCQVRNLQVFGDTLYYLYNFNSIIAVNVETGKYKGSFKYIAEVDKMVVTGTSEQFDYKYAGRVLYDLHAGRYSRELHAHVGIYSYCYTDFIYEIDYNTLTAKARRVDVSSLWPGEELGSMQMIGQDRLAVYPKDRRSLAILPAIKS